MNHYKKLSGKKDKPLLNLNMNIQLTLKKNSESPFPFEPTKTILLLTNKESTHPSIHHKDEQKTQSNVYKSLD